MPTDPKIKLTIHDLKILADYFDDVASGTKTFEIRKNDRGFKRGDILVLREINGGSSVSYTGRMIAVHVTYITNYEQKDGYVVMGISNPIDNQ